MRHHRAPLLTLIALWMLFFWRILTPIDADKASFKQGDFSAQFVAFGAYQYARFTDGEIPLWNPHNNSGLPFLADTQAAVFYPPRWLTLIGARLAGGWSYHALELEAILHVLFYTLALYGWLHAQTRHRWGALSAAIVGGYGGYLSGYPPLQLALLEAGVWLPMVMWALWLTHARKQPTYDLLAGVALGMSWLAGHPQTSWFLTYLAIAYSLFLSWQPSLKATLTRSAAQVVRLGTVTFGVTAVSFLPGIDYLLAAARNGFGYASKGNGFPLADVFQLLYPTVMSAFSPLYIGVVGLWLAAAALVSVRQRQVWFWGGVALFGLLLSFGDNAPLFPALYNLLPGLRYFRGQERAAYLVANSLAVLVAYGVAYGLSRPQAHTRPLRALAWLSGTAWALVMLLALGFPQEYQRLTTPFTLTFAVVCGAWAWSQRAIITPRWQALLVVLLTLELFTVNMGAPTNYDNRPPQDQVPFNAPALVQPILNAQAQQTAPVRIDGFRGVGGNYASLYGLYDARGISPLFFDGLYQLQQAPFADLNTFELNPRFWELNAVQYVYSGYDVLPIASEIIAQGADIYGTVYLHELQDPRPFAQLIYRADTVDSDAFARALLADARYQPRENIILHSAPTLPLPATPPTGGSAQVSHFTPEQFSIAINTPTNALLSLAHPHARGWQATLNGQPVALLRAYGGFSAVEIPDGEHTLTLTYAPLPYRIGAALTGATWLSLAAIALYLSIRRRTSHAVND